MQQILKSPPPQQYGAKMIDAELGIIAMPTDDMPKWVKDQFLEDTPYDSLSQLTFFFHPGADAVVLNRGHKNADFYELLVTTYLGVDGSQRQAIRQLPSADKVRGALDLLDFVILKRRERVRH